MRKILILGAGIYQVPLIKKAKEMGLYTIVVSINGNYPGFKYADKVYYIDTIDTGKVLEVAQLEKIDAVCTTGTDVAVVTLGVVCDKLNLPGLSQRAGILSTNKVEMKKAFMAEGVNTAKFQYVYSLKEANDVYDKFTKPVIFKAVDSSGSRGIIKVNEKDKVEYAFNKVYEVTKEDYFIIEEFITGVEFGAQASVLDGKIQFTMSHGDILFEGDAAVPIGHYVPFPVSDKVRRDVDVQLAKCVEALELDECAINADFILKDDKVYVLEIGARAGATCLVELVSNYYNNDYYEYLINLALGTKPSFDYNGSQPCANLLLYSETGGEITEIIDKNSDKRGILDFSMDYRVGDRIRKFRVGPDRIGQVIVKDSTLEKTMERLEEVSKNIEIRVNP